MWGGIFIFLIKILYIGNMLPTFAANFCTTRVVTDEKSDKYKF